MRAWLLGIGEFADAALQQQPRTHCETNANAIVRESGKHYGVVVRRNVVW